MSDFFKSAMGYFNGPADTSSSSGGGAGNGIGSANAAGNGPENDFVGQLVEVDGMKLRIRRLIAMGE